MAYKTQIVLVCKEIRVNDAAVDPKPCLVGIERRLLFLGKTYDTVLNATPFQRQGLVFIKDMACTYLVCINRLIDRVGVPVAVGPIDDLPFYTQLSHPRPSAASVYNGKDNPHLINMRRDLTRGDYGIWHSWGLVREDHQEDLRNEEFGYFGCDCGASVKQSSVRRFLGSLSRVGGIADTLPHQPQLPHKQTSLNAGNEYQQECEDGQVASVLCKSALVRSMLPTVFLCLIGLGLAAAAGVPLAKRRWVLGAFMMGVGILAGWAGVLLPW